MNYHNINKAIAEKIMGWEAFKDDDGTIISWVTEYGNLFFSDDEGSEWQPSTDMADAWQVVEKMAEDNEWVLNELEHSLDHEGRINGFYCYFHHLEIGSGGSVKAETAPLAICLAALKAKGIDVEREDK
jgi:hypothetical protein